MMVRWAVARMSGIPILTINGAIIMNNQAC